jgi:hypothetical protein
VPLIRVAWALEFDTAHSTNRTDRLPQIEEQILEGSTPLAFRILDSGGDDSICSSCKRKRIPALASISTLWKLEPPKDSRRGGTSAYE